MATMVGTSVRRIMLCASALAFCATSGSVAAQAPDVRLTACVAAAKAAATEPDPTVFKCDWRAVLQAKPGAILSGRYVATFAGFNGAMTIVESGGAAEIAIATVHRASGQTCSATATVRASDAGLIGTSEDAPECSLRITPTAKKDVVRVKAENCQVFCGVRALMDGDYRLAVR